MATRSRLGRDPLQGAAKPAAKQPAKTQRKSPARAKAAPQPSAVEPNAPPATVANDSAQLPLAAAPDAVQPAGTAQPAKIEKPAKSDAPSASGGAVLPAAPVPVVDALSASDMPAAAILPDRASPAGQENAPTVAAAAPRFETAALLPDADGPGLSAASDPASPGPAGTPLDDALFGEAALAKGTTALVAPKAQEAAPALTRCECANATPEAPSAEPVAATVQGAACAPEVPSPVRPTPVTLEQGAHPVEVFLRGVLEGLLPEGEAVLRVEVDPETFALPVEKLFYFSHALQRIVTPMEHLNGVDWRPGELAGPLPVLTVRLRAHSPSRHVLTLTDNGQFFRSRLPELRLGMEALKPLVAFVVKRQGSVCLAQGHSITFEIIG